MKKIVLIIMAAALVALPTMAQEWRSTSTMQGAGSNLAPQVTAVGATSVEEMATTTTPSGPHRAKKEDPDPWGGANMEDKETEVPGGSPVGDALLPLMLCAIVFCGYIAIRRKRAA